MSGPIVARIEPDDGSRPADLGQPFKHTKMVNGVQTEVWTFQVAPASQLHSRTVQVGPDNLANPPKEWLDISFPLTGPFADEKKRLDTGRKLVFHLRTNMATMDAAEAEKLLVRMRAGTVPFKLYDIGEKDSPARTFTCVWEDEKGQPCMFFRKEGDEFTYLLPLPGKSYAQVEEILKETFVTAKMGKHGKMEEAGGERHRRIIWNKHIPGSVLHFLESLHHKDGTTIAQALERIQPITTRARLHAERAAAAELHAEAEEEEGAGGSGSGADGSAAAAATLGTAAAASHTFGPGPTIVELSDEESGGGAAESKASHLD